jgi:heme exporter protein B
VLKQTISLIQKEFVLEFRQKYALGAIVLYAVSTVFICYLSFHTIDDRSTWNALFWVIELFAATNAVSKSFGGESKEIQLYTYTLASPGAVILSKIIYNILLTIVLTLVTILVYSTLVGNPVVEKPLFFGAAILGASGFAAVLTMVSAIASRTNGNLALMAILSIPLLMPILIIVIKLSSMAVSGMLLEDPTMYLIALGGLNIVTAALGYLLFPYLWHD